MDKPFVSYKISDRSFLALLKREIHNLVAEAGFDTHRAGQIDIVVSELASNLLKHADEGEVIYRVVHRGSGPVFEIYAFDNGPGIVNFQKVLRDGYSTANTLGHGLGSIKRLSDKFEIYSQKDWGTVQYIAANGGSKKGDLPEHALLQVPAPGETVCGDAVSYKTLKQGFMVLVCDGLGHGQNAAEAAEAAINFFDNNHYEDLSFFLREIHTNVRKTRGLVATIVHADTVRRKWRVCGVGNISTRIYTGLSHKAYTAYNGIIGHNIPRTINVSEYDMEPHQLLLMCSDGLRTRWTLSDWQGLLQSKPECIAGTLYKDLNRGNDDTTVFALKVN